MDMEFLRRTWVEVSLDNLTFNYQQIRAVLPAGTRYLGVVKADGYGHGAVAVARHLESLGAEFLAVSNLEEATQLRKGGISLPILMLGYTSAEFAAYEAAMDIRQEVNDITYARALSAALQGSGKTLKIHLKLDTGMSRLGFFAYDRPETIGEIAEIAALPNLEIEGTFHHFCVADSYDPEARRFTRLQQARFLALLEEMRAHGIDPGIRHACNSAALLLYPEFAMDMVRPGIITYGLSPAPELDGIMPLRPMLSWHSAISQIKDFPAGITVSYGRRWTTPAPRRIAVLPVGYADGLYRGLSSRVQFLLHGRPLQQVGRICMDMCMVDVTDFPGAKVGDTVTLLGYDGSAVCRCEDMAAAADTIPYEITCNISKRVSRLFIQNGEQIDLLHYIV